MNFADNPGDLILLAIFSIFIFVIGILFIIRTSKIAEWYNLTIKFQLGLFGKSAEDLRNVKSPLLNIFNKNSYPFINNSDEGSDEYKRASSFIKALGYFFTFSTSILILMILWKLYQYMDLFI